MQDQSDGLIAWMDAILGGAATTIVTAVVTRLAFHGQQVRKRERPLVGIELLFEPPIAVSMALAGDALSDYLGLSHHVAIGVVAVLAWVGPRGAQAMLDRWIVGKIGGGK